MMERPFDIRKDWYICATLMGLSGGDRNRRMLYHGGELVCTLNYDMTQVWGPTDDVALQKLCDHLNERSS